MRDTLVITLGQWPEQQKVEFDLETVFKVLKAFRDSFDLGYRHTKASDWLVTAYNFDGRVN